jgi:hypothetical protein
MGKKELNKLNLDAADAYSENPDTAEEYLLSEDVDIDGFITRGLDELQSFDSKPKKSLSNSQSFFRRVVLAARITEECHSERTFGSVKFQKLLYLCEHASNMKFNTSYTKQAAGPMDNRFIYAVKPEFEKQRWFKVDKIKDGTYAKVVFTPLENVDGYKIYYNRYFKDSDDAIMHLINTFRRWTTKDIELVATIYSCWEEILKEKAILTEAHIVERVYLWHKEKEKFKKNEIVDFYDWMIENNIVPAG